jgi:hypothetical protein
MSSPKAIPVRNGSGRGSPNEKPAVTNGTSPQRRNSWFSNISSKFSSSPNSNSSSPIADGSLQNAPVVPKVVPTKNAVLQHAVRHDGEGPYTPAPPKSGQAGFLGGVLRRLSASGGVLGPGMRGNHGLVERKVLNVDQNRERCQISHLNQAKLRRVAFCVDVEIAPMPKYTDAPPITATGGKVAEKLSTRKAVDKGEGDALKNAKLGLEDADRGGSSKPLGSTLANDAEKIRDTSPEERVEAGNVAANTGPEKEKDTTKKKEKKKKSEEERKARKEKKRKLAEANGTIPMEIHVDSSDSSDSATPTPGTPRTTAFPTTNPVRVYRRCCQLRETPILKKLTEQLTNPANYSSETGQVEKLDLTGYWLQLADWVTLGDYLAVVPVREIVFENCGLTDEALRVVLAGLLAAKRPASKRRKQAAMTHQKSAQGGVVERLVLKNNKIGLDGWKHLCLFIYMCRTLRFLDLSNIQFPQPPNKAQNVGNPAGAIQLEMDVAQLFSKSLGERLAGPVLELLTFCETNPTSEQLGIIVDGATKCGLRRFGLAHNHLDKKGVEHVARYLAAEKCEGLDLGGNDLRDTIEIVSNAISETGHLWAISLADCNLETRSLCKIFPKLTKLNDFRFIDLSHNQELFKSDPTAIGILRR